MGINTSYTDPQVIDLKKDTQVFLSDIRCHGNESTLMDCSPNRLGDYTCSGALVGVSCMNCNPGEIRLRGGTDTAGRLEICVNGEWGTVCGNAWSGANALVACTQLGYGVAGEMIAEGIMLTVNLQLHVL